MSEQNQIEVFKNNIAVPGCTFTRTGLSISEPSNELFRGAFAFLQTVEGCSAWWWGDLIVAHSEWDGSDDAGVGRYATKWADLLGREESTVRDWVQTATFYPRHSRNDSLSWAHHREAKMGAGGDLAVAQEWLDRAEKKDWSKTDLRAAIRLDQRKEDGGDEVGVETRVQELIAFNRWSRAQINRVTDMQPRERERLLNDLEPACRLIETLKSFQKKAA